MKDNHPQHSPFRWFLIIITVPIAAVLIWWMGIASPGTVYRTIRYNTSGINDNRIFPSRPLQASQHPFQFQTTTDADGEPLTSLWREEIIPLAELLQANDTTAFLIIRDDTILFEEYTNGGSQETASLSFSMAKSITSILIGCAIDDGYLQSVDQPVTDFVPELADNGFDKVTLRHLLQMTSGLDYQENDNIFGLHSRYYYTAQLEEELLKLELAEPPGIHFDYKSGENALMGLILSRALGDTSITSYLQQRIWEPLGMEYDGSWSLDHEGGLEKTWCCLSAAARDYAKLGRLYLNGGDWNGQRIVSEDWVEQSHRIDTSDGSVRNYQYQWWMMSPDGQVYMAVGHLGQFLYVDSADNIIIVRLGWSEGDLSRQTWYGILNYVARNLE